jgi:hypothetical protein
MSIEELRDLVKLLDTCTANNHPTERTGHCGAANRRYKARYAKGRKIDQTLAEFDRVVRFQRMFKPTGPRITEFEDRINSRLRSAARTSLAAAEVERNREARNFAPPDVTRDVKMSP